MPSTNNRTVYKREQSMNRDEQLALADKVAADFYKRVKFKVGRKAFNRIDLDELKQDAACFVLECFADEQMSDPAYCERAIINFLRRQTRATVKTANIESEFELDEFGEDNDPALIDPAPFADPCDRAAMNEVMSAVASLTTKQQYAVAGYMNGETLDSLGDAVGISHQAITDRFRNGIFSLRTKLRIA